MKLKKALLYGLSFVLVAGLATGGTVAYMTRSANNSNAMAYGNVKVIQHEYQRAEVDGEFEITTIDGKTSYVLEEFEDRKELMPVVGDALLDSEHWDDVTVNMSQVNSYGDMPVCTSRNAQDLFVTVENVGSYSAYLRLLVAIEVGDANPLLIKKTYHSSWVETTSGLISIEGVNYFLSELTYVGAQLDDGGWIHENGVVPPGEITCPGLAQVYLSSEATTEDIAKIDGNGDGEFNVIVHTQAVQAEGFDGATFALDEAFGEISEENHPWLDGLRTYDYYVSSDGELREALTKGGSVLLVGDFAVEKIISIPSGVESYLDMNGKKLTVNQNTASNTMFYVMQGGKLTVDGNGIIDTENKYVTVFYAGGDLIIENGTYVRNRTTSTGGAALLNGLKGGSPNMIINGGYFDSGYYDANANFDTFSETADDIAKRGKSGDKNRFRVALKQNITSLINHQGVGSMKVYGGTFVGANPAWGDEGCMMPTTPQYLRPWSNNQGYFLYGQVRTDDRLDIPEGYTITEGATDDGRPTYTINYSE